MKPERTRQLGHADVVPSGAEHVQESASREAREDSMAVRTGHGCILHGSARKYQGASEGDPPMTDDPRIDVREMPHLIRRAALLIHRLGN